MPKKKFPRLDSLDFGSLDSRQESSLLIRKGYFDFQDAARRIADGSAWLLVGPKGAGKSAVFEHMKLDWENAPTRFFNYWAISTSPIEEVLVADTGLSKGHGSTIVAWKLLLLGPVFESLLNDNGAYVPASAVALQKKLTEVGFLAPKLQSDLSGRENTTSVRFNIKIIDVQKELKRTGLSIFQAVSLIEQEICKVQTSSQHVLAIDELDRLFGQTDEELDSVGGLLDAIRELNFQFSSNDLRAHIVLGIRHDMLANVPSTDSAKLRENTVLLDWSAGRANNGEDLWKIVSRKAKMSVPKSFDGLQLGDIRHAYLRRPIYLGPFTEISRYFISNTRFLPRDIVALMQSLQEVHPGSGEVSEGEARAAAKLYGESYFVHELVNNLTRTVASAKPSQVRVFFDALGSMNDRRFSREDVESELEGEIEPATVKSLLRQLFHSSGIGVIKSDGQVSFTSFDYRRIGGGRFSPNRTMILHNALVEAWGFKW